MLKKTITYKDYNDEERTEDFYFNLSKAELMELESSVPGGLTEAIRHVVAAKDAPELMKLFKNIILKAYGEKSPDGKRFIKSEELSIAFSQTEAYSQLFMEMFTDLNAGEKFVRGIVPSDVAKKIAENDSVKTLPNATV